MTTSTSQKLGGQSERLESFRPKLSLLKKEFYFPAVAVAVKPYIELKFLKRLEEGVGGFNLNGYSRFARIQSFY